MGAISEQKVQSYTFVKQILETFLRLNRDLVARKSRRILPWLERSAVMARTIARGQTVWVQIITPSFISYVVMGRLLICSVLQFCNLQIPDNKTSISWDC